MKGHTIKNVGTPVNSSDVATKSYVLASGGSGLSQIVSLNELNQALNLTDDLNFLTTGDNSINKHVLVELPTSNKHVSNK